MALDTSKRLRNLTMYSIFVRNYSEEGTFDAVRRDLGRIRALGVDLLWFLPIHPIGRAGRKGTLGSPYAIADYRAVDPAYGTLADFKRLVEEATWCTTIPRRIPGWRDTTRSGSTAGPTARLATALGTGRM